MNSIWSDLEARLSSVTPAALRELSLLWEFVSGTEPSRFHLQHLFKELPDPSPELQDALCALVSRRVCGEPLQYLLGTADFYGYSYVVRPGVLIPRFDSEILVHSAELGLFGGESVLDLCAGSGCLGLTLGARRNISVTLVEKYDDAFSVLQENAAAICPGAHLVQADVLTDSLDGSFDFIVSNPPYIPTSELRSLSADVQQEPVTALDGGEDGLDFYRVLIRRFWRNLKPGGRFYFECGIGQAPTVAQLFLNAGASGTQTIRDYGGIERVVCGLKPSEDSHV